MESSLPKEAGGIRMAMSNQEHLQWLCTLSTEEAWKQIINDATIGTRVYPEKFLKGLSPLPDFKNRTEVRRWLDWVLVKIDLDMSVEEAKVLHICCNSIAAVFKTTSGPDPYAQIQTRRLG
jgi:hypothetical protein